MLNSAVILGRLVADPELRHTPNDISVTTFTLAVDRSYAKAGEERHADFIDVVAWRGTAEFVCKYFRKGQMMAVQGAIQTHTYTDRDGNKRKTFEIIADNVSFTGSKRDSCDTSGSAGSSTYASRPAAAAAEPVPDYTSGGNADFEETSISDYDLPF